MEQIEKNTVPAENQLRNNPNITFEGTDGGYPKIMFVGNSITRHAEAPHIGWNNDFGMAASSKDRDYVHLVEKYVTEKYPSASFCICQAAEWECGYCKDGWTNDSFASARAFGADYIIFRVIENVSRENFSHEKFTASVREFLGYLNPGGNAKIIMTTGFWRHPGDSDLTAVAREDGYPLAELGVFGDDDGMKALGLFSHEGVANHPGDRGMAAIAESIEKLLEL